MDNQEEIEVELEVETPEQDDDQQEPQVEVAEDDTAEDDAESIVTFGDDELPEEGESIQAEAFIRMRREKRQLKLELEELRAKQAKTDDDISPLGARPTLEGSEYDEGKFAESLEAWYADKARHDKAEEAKKKAAEDQAKAWQDRMGEYTEAKASFDPEKVDDAEAIAREVLSETQQGVLIEALGAGAAALLVGLSSNEKRLRDLAKVKNPIRFAAEVARLESIMKTSKRKPRSAPEARVAGNGSIATGGQDLEKLKAAAEKTGDYDAYFSAKRKQK